MSRLLGLLARAWRALTAPVDLDAGRVLDGLTHDGYPGGEPS